VASGGGKMGLGVRVMVRLHSRILKSLKQRELEIGSGQSVLVHYLRDRY